MTATQTVDYALKANNCDRLHKHMFETSNSAVYSICSSCLKCRITLLYNSFFS